MAGGVGLRQIESSKRSSKQNTCRGPPKSCCGRSGPLASASPEAQARGRDPLPLALAGCLAVATSSPSHRCSCLQFGTTGAIEEATRRRCAIVALLLVPPLSGNRSLPLCPPSCSVPCPGHQAPKLSMLPCGGCKGVGPRESSPPPQILVWGMKKGNGHYWQKISHFYT